jgi:hypothetical protein
MHLLSGLALVLLSLLGYSAGAVAAGSKRQVMPDLLDIAIVIALWVAALVTRGNLGRWVAVGLWLVAGLVTGAAATSLRLKGYSLQKALPGPLAARRWKRIWTYCSAFSQRIGNYQSRMLLALFYFLIVFPFGIGVRLIRDPLRVRRRPDGSSWVARERADTNLESARSQF